MQVRTKLTTRRYRPLRLLHRLITTLLQLNTNTRTTKSPLATLRLRQLLHLDRWHHANLFQNQLCNSIADIDFKIVGSEIEEDYSDIAAVVGVYYSGAAVDHFLDG